MTDRIIEYLASDDERTREAGADAAYALLVGDPMPIVALGQPLAVSVRGKESGYAGEPHPASAALRLWARAGEATLIRRIVETQAVVAGAEARVELVGRRGERPPEDLVAPGRRHTKPGQRSAAWHGFLRREATTTASERTPHYGAPSKRRRS